MCVSSQSLENILHLGLTLTDSSSIGFMKDYYPLKLFSLENLFTLLEKNKKDEFLYFLPFTLMIEAILSDSLKKNSRLYFLKISFHILYCFYRLINQKKLISGITIKKTKNSKAQFFNNQIFIIRCLNTIILTYSIMISRDKIKLNRIGTHNLENFFGRVRMICKNFDSYENFLCSIVKTLINSKINKKYNLNCKVRNRINVAGGTITNESGWLNYDDLICDEIGIAKCAFYKCGQDINFIFEGQLPLGKYDDFLHSFFEYFNLSDKITKKIYRPKISSGSKIKERCNSVSKEKKAIESFD